MKTIDELRTETNGETRLLWHCNYWDGPLSGVMLWKGEKCWFQSVNDISVRVDFTPDETEDWRKICSEEGFQFRLNECAEYENHRIFQVYRIPVDEMQKIEEEHALFEQYVGTHTSYDENGNRPHGKTDGSHLRPYSEHQKYYERKDKHTFHIDPKTSKYDCIGVFEIS